MNIGLSSAFVPIGVCEDGADLTFRIYASDIKFDGAGGPGGAEAENIFLNMTIDARFSFVPYGGTYLNQLRALAGAVAGTLDGVMASPSTLYGMNGFLPSLYLPSTFDPDGGWLFTQGRVIIPGDNKLAVTETKPTISYRAYNFINPSLFTTIFGRVLYQRK